MLTNWIHSSTHEYDKKEAVDWTKKKTWRFLMQCCKGRKGLWLLSWQLVFTFFVGKEDKRVFRNSDHVWVCTRPSSRWQIYEKNIFRMPNLILINFERNRLETVKILTSSDKWILWSFKALPNGHIFFLCIARMGISSSLNKFTWSWKPIRSCDEKNIFARTASRNSIRRSFRKRQAKPQFTDITWMCFFLFNRLIFFVSILAKREETNA